MTILPRCLLSEDGDFTSVPGERCKHALTYEDGFAREDVLIAEQRMLHCEGARGVTDEIRADIARLRPLVQLHSEAIVDHRTGQAAPVQRRHAPGSTDQIEDLQVKDAIAAEFWRFVVVPGGSDLRGGGPDVIGTGDLGSVEPRSGIADRIRHVCPLTCCILAHERDSRRRAPRSSDRDGAAVDVGVRSLVQTWQRRRLPSSARELQCE